MLNALWLETFATLAETGHFTRAAARLNMTQPGVSQHLRKLEAQIGRPLLSRQGKGFTLTPAGEAVFDMARARREENALLRELGELIPRSLYYEAGTSAAQYFRKWGERLAKRYPDSADEFSEAVESDGRDASK